MLSINHFYRYCSKLLNKKRHNAGTYKDEEEQTYQSHSLHRGNASIGPYKSAFTQNPSSQTGGDFALQKVHFINIFRKAEN